MSSTPKNNDSKPTTPPKTNGWGYSLFGTTWLSSKKTSHVESSTKSTSLKQQTSPKPFQNLEGFNTVHSPDLGTSRAFGTTSDSAPRAAASLRQLQQTTPSASGSGTQKSTAVPSKSPWKAPLMSTTNGAGFSVNLKTSSSRVVTTRNNGRNYSVSTTTSVAPEPLDRLRLTRRPNRYRTRGVFAVRRNNGGKKRIIDKNTLNELLMKARPEIEAPKQKIESDRKIRTEFSSRVCRMGRRLHTSDRGRRYDRLPNPQQSSNDDTKFITNGKRDIERDDDQKNTEAAMSKRRKVKKVSLPIETLVATPAKDRDSRSGKRKATPHKPARHTIDDDGDGEDKKSPPASNRKLYKLKRSPSSKTSDAKSGTSNVQGIEDFPVKPRLDIIIDGDFSSWPKEQEISAPTKSNKIISESFMDYFRQTFETNLCSTIRNGKPQFQQQPLFNGPKKDRTVPDYDDDDDDETGPDAKRPKAATWKCSTCGFDNDDEETRCQKFVLKDGATKKTLCNQGRTAMIKLNWGNQFDYLTKGKIKCTSCHVMNDKSRTTCVSCEAPLPHAQNSTSAAKPEKISALGGSIGSQGFSFGGATAGEKTSTGFSFGNSASGGTGAGQASSTSSGTMSSGGFKFGAPAPSASSSALTNGGFQFGAKTNVKSPSEKATSAANTAATSGMFQFGAGATPNSSSLKKSSTVISTTKTSATTGGFKFGVPAEAKSPAKATTSVPASGTESSGFRFGAPAESKLPSITKTTTPSSSPVPASKSTTKPFTFGSSAPSSSPSVGVKPAPSPSTGNSSGSQLFGKFASSSTPGSSATKTPKFTFGANKDLVSTSKKEVAKVSTTEPATKRKNIDSDKEGFAFPSSSTKDNDSEQRAPSFSFGSAPVDASTTAKPATSGFSFGSSSASNTTTSSATAGTATAPKFSFGTTGGSSTGSSGAAMPSLRSVATEGNDDNDAKKKRSRNDPKTSLGSKLYSEPSSASALSKGGSASSTQARAPAPFVFGMPSANSAKEDNSATNAPGFGSSTAPPSFGKGSNNSITASVTKATTPAPSFGSTPAPSTSISFGSTPAPVSTPAAPFSFGSTPALATTPAAPFSFGSTPAAPTFGSSAPAPAAPTFGSSAPAPAAPTFGSSAPAPAAPTFGSSAPAQAAPTFGSSAPAPTAPTFGSTAPAPAAPSFGATAPAPAAPTFGATAPAPAAPIAFGSTPAPGSGSGFGSTQASSNAMNFGSTTPAQSTTFGSTPAAVPAPFGAPTPMPFGSSTPAPTTVPFGSSTATPSQPFGNNTAPTFGSAQPSAGAAPMAFGGNPAPGGFGAGGFGQQATQQQPSAPPNAGFSLGTGGGAPRGRTPGRGRRRVIKARRPT